ALAADSGELPDITGPGVTGPVVPPSDTAPVPAGRPGISPLLVCLVVWAGVALGVFGYHFWRYLTFVRAVRRWGVPAEGAMVDLFRQTQREMGLGEKDIELALCGFAGSSLLAGFFRPMVILPEKNFGPEELILIFRHELAHFRRRDLIVKSLSLVVLSLHWFNPLVHWMCAAMQADVEAACDEEVLKGSDDGERHFYAELIIGMIEGKPRLATMLSTCFYLRGKFGIKRRLAAILDSGRERRWLSVPVLAAVLSVVLFSGSVFAFASSELFSPELPLSPDAGIRLALARVGGGLAEEFERERRRGRAEYDVKIRHEGMKHTISIDVATAEITRVKTSSSSSVKGPVLVSIIRAMEIAMAEVGGGIVEDAELDGDKGKPVWKIKVGHSGRTFKVKIDAITAEPVAIK
ncbi:MAG: M56 family metallopeptidase, partial [Treponema sp.]|nr:M56 family metallopeptidase [Treponema sp.]